VSAGAAQPNDQVPFQDTRTFQTGHLSLIGQLQSASSLITRFTFG
jgi:hypothetical protein